MRSETPDSHLPMCLESEQALLGCCLIEPDLLIDWRDKVSAGDFFREAHGHIWEALLHLDDARATIDLLSVADVLEARGQLERCGGRLYLMNLMEAPATTANMGHYHQRVKDRAQRRRLMCLAQEAFRQARDETDTAVDALIEQVEQSLSDLSCHGDGGRTNGEHAGTIATDLLREIESGTSTETAKPISTGLPPLDHLLSGGLHRSDLILLAGRPGMGKTGLGLQIALSAALAGRHVLFASLEMPRRQIVRRGLSNLSWVDHDYLRAGKCPVGFLPALRAEVERLQASHLLIDDTRDVTLHALRSIVRRSRQVDLLVVDYLQQIRVPHSHNRQEEVADVARGLKTLAREIDCPVVALAQVGRGAENRQDKRPMLSDLRESGQLEAECDVCLLPYRPEYYKGEKPRIERAEIIVAKHRNGATGKVECVFHPAHLRFDPLSDRDDAPDLYEPDPFADDA